MTITYCLYLLRKLIVFRNHPEKQTFSDLCASVTRKYSLQQNVLNRH